jgi:amino acid transporter
MRGFFSRINPTVRGLLIVAAIALVIVVLQLQATLVALSTLLQIVFFIAIAIVLYLLWRDRLRWEIETWGDRPRWVFYGAGALILVDLGAFFAFGASGLGAVAFLLVLGICGYAMYRTWRGQRNLSY